MNNNAMISDNLVKLILILVAFFVLVGVTKGITAVWNEEEGSALCRLGIALKIGTKLCETEYRNVIPYDDEPAIYGYLAEKMRTCWHQVYEGKADIKKSMRLGTQARTDRPLCLICSINEFSETAQQQHASGLRAFSDYLGTKKMPGQDQTYFEYFSGTTTLEGHHIDRTIEDNILYPTQRYAILVAQGDETSYKQYATWGVAGAAIGFFFGPLGHLAGVTIGGVSGLVASFLVPDQIYTSLLFLPYGDAIGQNCYELG